MRTRTLRSVQAFALLLSLALSVPAAAQAPDVVGPLELRARPSGVDNPVPRRLTSAAPTNPGNSYPPIIVELRVTLDEQGRVGEVRPLGPARDTYSLFIPNGLNGEVFAFPPVMDGPRHTTADFDRFVASAMAAVHQWQYEAPTNGPITFDVRMAFGPSGEVRVLWDGYKGAGPRPRGSGPQKVKDAAPTYPAIALLARAQGTVIVEATVEPNGQVISTRILKSIPLLDRAAADAVMQWAFAPTLVNGLPVRVTVTTVLQFTLAS